MTENGMVLSTRHLSAGERRYQLEKQIAWHGSYEEFYQKNGHTSMYAYHKKRRLKLLKLHADKTWLKKG